MASLVRIAGGGHHLSHEHGVVAGREAIHDLAFYAYSGTLDARRLHLERGDSFDAELSEFIGMLPRLRGALPCRLGQVLGRIVDDKLP